MFDFFVHYKFFVCHNFVCFAKIMLNNESLAISKGFIIKSEFCLILVFVEDVFCFL